MSPLRRLRALFGAYPLRTMAIWLALVVIVFLTRGRWEAWVVERESLRRLDFHPLATPDGRRIVMVKGKTVMIWDAESDWPRSLRLDGPYAGTVVSPDGKTVVVKQVPVFLRWIEKDVSAVWRYPPPLLINVESGDLRSRLAGHTREAWSVAYSPDGSRIVTAAEEGTVRVWDSAWGNELLVLRGHKGPVFTAAYSADGSRIVTAGADRTVRIWEAATGEAVAALEGHRGPVGSAEFTSGGSRVIAWCHRDKTCHLWDAHTGAQVAVLQGADSCSCSPDGSRIVTTHAEQNAAHIWDARTGAHIAKVDGHDCDYPSWIKYSSDGKRVMTCGADRTIRVWDAETGVCLFALCEAPGDWEGIGEAEFTPDGSRIVTCGVHRARRAARIWDATTGKVLAAIPDVLEFCVLESRRIVVSYENAWPGTHVRRRIRPEYWWGVFYLWHFWVIVALGFALALSVWKDVRDLRRGQD